MGTRRLTRVHTYSLQADKDCHGKAAPARLTACRTTWHGEFLDRWVVRLALQSCSSLFRSSLPDLVDRPQ